MGLTPLLQGIVWYSRTVQILLMYNGKLNSPSKPAHTYHMEHPSCFASASYWLP